VLLGMFSTWFSMGEKLSSSRWRMAENRNLHEYVKSQDVIIGYLYSLKTIIS